MFKAVGRKGDVIIESFADNMTSARLDIENELSKPGRMEAQSQWIRYGKTIVDPWDEDPDTPRDKPKEFKVKGKGSGVDHVYQIKLGNKVVDEFKNLDTAQKKCDELNNPKPEKPVLTGKLIDRGNGIFEQERTDKKRSFVKPDGTVAVFDPAFTCREHFEQETGIKMVMSREEKRNQLNLILNHAETLAAMVKNELEGNIDPNYIMTFADGEISAMKELANQYRRDGRGSMVSIKDIVLIHVKASGPVSFNSIYNYVRIQFPGPFDRAMVREVVDRLIVARDIEVYDQDDVPVTYW